MSKTKKVTEPHYELLCLISNEFAEDEVKPIIEKVKKLITDKDGKITRHEDWGKRRLAYPIRQFKYGYYNLVEFDLKGEETNKIDRSLKLMNEILRHQIVNKKVKTAEEIAKEIEIKKKIAAKEEKEEERIKTEEKETKKKKDAKKIGLEDLDEKLDKILETDDLI